MSFAKDYARTDIVWPAHRSNYYQPEDHGGIENKPRALVLHTPEEPWDNNETTPAYFASANRQASTHYYADSDGDWYQMVPERCAAIANGLRNKPRPAWADPVTSLNWQTLSVEIEGYAATIHQFCNPGTAQWESVVRWVEDRTRAHGIPLDRSHVIGHYEVADNRTDPGQLDIQGIVNAAMVLRHGQEEDNMAVAIFGQPNSPKNYLVLGGKRYHLPSKRVTTDMSTAYGVPIVELDKDGWALLERMTTEG